MGQPWDNVKEWRENSMACIEKRKLSDSSFGYRVRIRQKGSPEITKTFPTRTEAVKWAQRMEADVRAGRYFGREEAKERTFAEFIDRYIEKELPKNPKEQKKNIQRLSWWKKHLGSYFLCHITPTMIADLRDKLMTETTPRKGLRSSSTANRYLAVLSRSFTVCHKEWRWIKENPVLQITRPKENKGRQRYLEKDEISRLLAACKKSKSPHLYAIVLFALGTGARKGEILGLMHKNLDLDRHTATFRDTKNGETRTVHLSKPIVKCLQEEIRKRDTLSEYVFPSQNGNKPADIRGGWEAAVQEAGLGKDVCFHSLRHTAASHLAMEGFSSLMIGKILGHKTIAMIKNYSHLSTSSTAGALDRLNSEIFGELVNVT
jgi:integrase